jgi:hypothetical protein
MSKMDEKEDGRGGKIKGSIFEALTILKYDGS